MEIKEGKVILYADTDYEFIKLVNHIIKTKYGEVKLKIKNGKPYQVIETQKSILLVKTVKDEESYGD
ncbi:MAG: hypothetical protein ACTSR2_00570 [Candidatus Hodarchaeales archaeon]